MPQGCAKKIRFQLLLTDFSLQLLDPTLSGPGWRRHGRRLKSSRTVC
jgi:hypothetical protein